VTVAGAIVLMAMMLLLYACMLFAIPAMSLCVLMLMLMLVWPALYAVDVDVVSVCDDVTGDDAAVAAAGVVADVAVVSVVVGVHVPALVYVAAAVNDDDGVYVC